jgi:outer membrane beta-barrel protein
MLKKPQPLPSYINGEFHTLTKPDKEFIAIRPADPQEVVAVTGWRKDLVSPIVEGLKTAFELHRIKSFDERIAFVRALIAAIREAGPQLRAHMMHELSRSHSAVSEEWRLIETVFSILPQFCEEVLKEKVSPAGWTWRYAPVGVVFVSSNVALPLYSILSAALPALVAGNAVCIRPSIHCPLTGYFLAQIVHRLGAPPGLIQVVFGDLEVYRQLIATHCFDTVLYAGGEESLEQIRRDLLKEGQTRMVLCSGGKNAAIVCAGADLGLAVDSVIHGMTVDTGQRLEATSLAFVEEAVLDEFVSRFVKSVKNLPTGVRMPLDTETAHVMGPLCSRNAWERFLRFQSIAAREAHETLRWGKPIDNPRNGFYVSPGVHLMKLGQLASSVYASNAFFGPDVAIVPVSSYHEAVGCIDKMNAARSLAVLSPEQRVVEEVRHASEVPTILWNCATTTVDPHLPAFGRGRAGNAQVTGVRFLFSAVYPKSLSLRQDAFQMGMLNAMLVLFALLVASLVPQGAEAAYRKAVEGNEVVKGKIYPREGRIQINALQFGGILNQSYVSTLLIPVGLTYHFNEWHALNAEFVQGISFDQGARECVESFYFSPERAKDASGDPNPCPPETPPIAPPTPNEGEKPAYQRKPAYVPIRQVEQLYALNYQWTPVYGKALWFMSVVGYLDFYTTAGLGLASSTFWPLQATTSTGARTLEEGVPAENESEWGPSGRPLPVSQMGPTVSLGIGSRMYFAKYFTFNLDFRNTTLFGDDGNGGTDIMNFLTVWGGFGLLL